MKPSPATPPGGPAAQALAASSLPDAIDAWIVNLGAAKPSPATLAAYRRDVEGVGGPAGGAGGLGDLGDWASPT